MFFRFVYQQRQIPRERKSTLFIRFHVHVQHVEIAHAACRDAADQVELYCVVDDVKYHCL